MSRRAQIGPLHPRVVATFALIPISIGIMHGFWWAYSSFAYRFMGSGATWWVEPFWALCNYIVPGVVVVAGWMWVWGPTVRWTVLKRRKLSVVFALAFLVLIGLAVVSYTTALNLGRLLQWISLIFGGVTIMFIGRICWDPPGGEETPCPNCGYDLRGQHECRCPECGEHFTVGELVNPDAGDTP